MASHSEVTKALELLGCMSPSSEDVGKFSSFTSNIVDLLFKSSSFSSGQNPRAREALRTTYAKHSSKLSFYFALSDALKLEETKTESTWEKLRTELSPTSATSELTSLENLLTIREVFSSHRSQLWSLLHEMIRIDLDSQHALHSTVSSALDSMLSRDLVGEVIKHLLQTLPQWAPTHVDRSVLGSFGDHEVSKYVQCVHQAWAVDYIEEYKRALDTLVLLSYSRQNLNLSELKEVLTNFFAQPLNLISNSALQSLLVHSMRSDLLKIEAELQAVNFRYIVLFSGCFQFWRLFQADLAAQRDHPLLLPSTPDYNTTSTNSNTTADKIFELLQSVTEVLQKSAAAQAKLIGLATNGASTGDTLVRTHSNAGILVPFNPTQACPSARIVLYLWQCFLKSFSECTIVGAEYVTTPAFQKFQSLSTQFEIMDDLSDLVTTALSGSSKLAQRVSLDPAQDQSVPSLSSEPNMFIYCSILQELTNVLILAHTLRDESSVLDLGPVTNLVESTYRGQSALCGGFWSAWTEAVETQQSTQAPVEHYYPLCRLVQTLLETTPHDPVYLFRTLSALACSPQACMSLLDLLNQPVNVIDFEHFSRLQFREAGDAHMFGAYDSLQWNGITAWLREHNDIPPGTLVMKVNPDTVNVSSRGQGLWSGRDGVDSTDSLNSNWYNKSRSSKTAPLNVPHVDSTSIEESSGLCVPADRSQGVVVDIDAEHRRCLVRWDTQSLWWTLAIDLLIKAASPAGPSPVSVVSLQALLDLLNALFKQGSVVAFFLETKWNEIALLSLLQDIKHAELFPLLSQHNVHIGSLRADPAVAFDRLTHDLGISALLSEQIVSKLMSPNAAESALYELSFAQLLSKVVLSVLQVALSTGSSPLLLTAWSMFVTVSDVCSDWAQALVLQSATRFPSVRGSGGVYEALYAVVSNASTALPEVFYLTSQHLIKGCTERRAQSGAAPVRVLFDSLDVKQNGYLSPTDVAHGLSSRGVEVSPIVLAELLEEAGLSGYRNLDYPDFYCLATGIDVRKPVPAESDKSAAVPLQNFRQSVLRAARTAKELSTIDDEAHARSAGIFVLNQFNFLYRATAFVGASAEEMCFLLLNTAQAIEALFSAEKSLATFIIENVANNVAFLEAIVHFSTLLSVLSTQSSSSASAGRAVTFKDLLSLPPGSVVPNAGPRGVLPLDFSAALGPAVPASVRESLIRISTVCSSILAKLAHQCTTNGTPSTATERRLSENLLALLAAPSPDRLSGLGWVSALMSAQGSNRAANASKGSNLCLLFSVLDLPTAAASSSVVLQYKLSVSRLLDRIVLLMPSGSGKSNVSDFIGAENVTTVAQSLAANVRAESTGVTSSVIQVTTLKFLLAVAKKQPAALSLFLSAQKTPTATGPGDLVEALVHLLTSAEHLYAQEPETLHTLYELIIVIFKSTEYHALVKTTLVLIQGKKFWDYVTAPLMLDVPPVPSLQTHVQPYSDKLWAESVLRSHHGFTEQAVTALESEVTEYVSSANLKEVETEVVLHAHRLHCHAAALELLSIERYGKFYEVDAAVALVLTKKMQAFYVKATESHRFISWIKHYLLISVDEVVARSVEEMSAVLGESALLTSDGEYGSSYKLPFEAVRSRLNSTYRVAAVQNLEVNLSDRVDLYLLARYRSELVKFNLSSSLADSALNLIHSWRQFLEFYVLPGSAAKQQEHKERSNSADGGTTPSRGRKHSFDGDDIDGFTSVSPQVGTLSPVTSAAMNSSPTAAKGSSFTGDKRSYEVVTEVMNQLECHREDGNMGSDVGRRAIAEKCELLVSMVHHQLKVVATRTSDPSKSVILTRDIGSMRLTQDKMEKLLEMLDDFYRDLIFAPTSASGKDVLDSASDLKSVIALRILTAMMLLLNAIFAFNSAGDVHSKLSMRRRSIYTYAVTALKNLTQTHGRAVFSNTSALGSVRLDNSHLDGAQEETKASGASNAPETRPSVVDRLSTEQAIAQVSLQIMKLAVPRSSCAEPLISLTDSTMWRDLLRDTGAVTLLTQVVSELSSATGDLPQWDHVYAGWRTSELEVGSRGGSECSPPRFLDRRVDARVHAEAQCMLVSLLSALEALVSGVAANIITAQNASQLNALLQVLITAPLLRNFQEVILAQPEELVSVLMGYNAVTTDVSLVATYWLRVVNLIESLIVRIGDTPYNVALRVSEAQQESAGSVVVTRQDLHNSICGFLRTYVDLLLLPMRPASHRYSVQQLNFTRAAFNLFSAANSKLPLWKVSLPTVHPEVSSRAACLLRVFSLLLWHGEDMETLEQQRRLLAHCVAVSKTEKREERTTQIRKLRKRSGSQGNTSRLSSGTSSTGSPQHVHFGATTVLGPGASIMKSGEAPVVLATGAGSSTKQRKPMGYYSSLRGGMHSSGGEGGSTEGVQHSMVEFLLDIEAHMIAAMAPLSAYMRQITPIPMEVSKFDEFGHPLFPLGNRVFYFSDSVNGSLMEGFVNRLHPSGDRFDVVLLDDMVECDVHASQVRFTAAPIVEYQSISDLAKHSIDDLSTTAIFYHGHAELSNSLSTAHLLRSLQLATSAVTGSRMQNQQLYPQAGQDLVVLAGQLAWLVVSNIAHHALVPMGREVSMIHQLNDLKRAIRPRDSAHSSYSSSTTGSTSPFMSYLDHRDRGHTTPVGGISSAAGTASTSAYLKWMHTPEWSQYVTFIDKWCEEIFYMLGRGATLVTAEEEEEEESPSARIRKKRVGLRARIEWVQSPEEV